MVNAYMQQLTHQLARAIKITSDKNSCVLDIRFPLGSSASLFKNSSNISFSHMWEHAPEI